MRFHIYGQKSLIELPNGTTIEDLRSLAVFNRIIKKYLKLLKLENNGKKR